MKVGIILGGGINENGDLPLYVLERVRQLRSLNDSLDKVITSSSFTLNKPPIINKNKFIYSEAVEIAKKVAEFYPKNNIVVENSSHDTIGSALFCRSIIENLSIQPFKVYLFTSSFHIKRAINIFRWAFSLEDSLVAKSSIIPVSCPSKETDERNLRESNSLNNFIDTWYKIKKLEVAWSNLFLNHSNYNLNFSSDFKASDNQLY